MMRHGTECGETLLRIAERLGQTSTTRIRNRLVAQQRGRCHWCGEPMTPASDTDLRAATLDHIIPLSRGGDNHITNLVAACYLCNNRRGNDLSPPPMPRRRR